MSNDLELLIAEMNVKIAALSEKVAYLERLENAAVDGTGPFVLKAGDTMTGELNIIPTAASIPNGLQVTINDPSYLASGGSAVLIEGDKPTGMENLFYLLRIRDTSGSGDWMWLRSDGSWVSYTNLAFTNDKGPASSSSGAMLRFKTGGLDIGGVDLDTSISTGTIQAINILTAIGNGCFYSYDGVDGTARIVRPNGADDVLYGVTGQFFIRDSAGNIAGGQITATAPGANFNLYDDGGTNTCQLQVAANGEIAVQRTAGSRTYKVMLLLIWI